MPTAETHIDKPRTVLDGMMTVAEVRQLLTLMADDLKGGVVLVGLTVDGTDLWFLLPLAEIIRSILHKRGTLRLVDCLHPDELAAFQVDTSTFATSTFAFSMPADD